MENEYKAHLLVRTLDEKREIVESIGLRHIDENWVEKVMMGMLRNMDTERYFIDDSEVDLVRENDGLLFRVWRIANAPNTPTHFPVASPEEGRRLIESLASLDLENPKVFDNAFGLETPENGEWSEWYNDDGEDVNQISILQ